MAIARHSLANRGFLYLICMREKLHAFYYLAVGRLNTEIGTVEEVDLENAEFVGSSTADNATEP